MSILCLPEKTTNVSQADHKQFEPTMFGNRKWVMENTATVLCLQYYLNTLLLYMYLVINCFRPPWRMIQMDIYI